MLITVQTIRKLERKSIYKQDVSRKFDAVSKNNFLFPENVFNSKNKIFATSFFLDQTLSSKLLSKRNKICLQILCTVVKRIQKFAQNENLLKVSLEKT